MNIEYQMLRSFADSWGLLLMALVFALVTFRALRPSARHKYEDAAHIPFKED